MTKVFISLGMSGRLKDDVEKDLEKAKANIHNWLGDSVEIVDNWDCVPPEGFSTSYCLGEAIKKLGDCDCCYFVDGWKNSRGCLMEHEYCTLYGRPIAVYETDEPFLIN